MKDWFWIRLTDEQRELQTQHLIFVETNIMLPVKVVAILVASYYCLLILGGWATEPHVTTDMANSYYTQLKVYTVGNLFFWGLLLAVRV